MNKILIKISVIGVFFVYGETNKATRATKILGSTEYFTKIITESMQEVEDLNWSNLKCDDYSMTLNERMYNWVVTGKVNYTNGFVVSIEKIAIDKLQGVPSSAQAIIKATLQFFDMKVGFDVTADLDNEGVHRYTGTFVHKTTDWDVSVTKNFATNEITTSARLTSLSGGLDKMVYMPADNISQVLSRKYVAGNIYDSVERWGTELFAPAMLRAANRNKFPTVCVSC